MFKAVLFDMDGVLIDSEPIHAKAFQLSMREYGLDLTLEYCYQFIGRTDRYLAETLIQEHHLEHTPEELLTSKNNMIEQLVQENGYPPIDYIKELVIDLYHHGIKLAIASSSAMDAIQHTAAKLGLTEYFSQYVSGRDLKHSKPAPDIFLKAADMLGVLPSECMIIEDSTHGVAAAKAANITCVGFYNPHSGKQDLSKADIIVEGFEEVDTNFMQQIYCHSHKEPFTITTTDRTIIRELSLSDMPELYRIYQQPEVRASLYDLEDYETEYRKLEAYIQNIYHFYHFGYWGVFDKETNQLIGRCGIQNNEIDGESEIELGYLLDSSYQGQGLAYEATKAIITYAFTHLDLPRLVAAIPTTNQKSLSLAKALGLHHNKTITYHNIPCDLYEITNPN